MKVHSTGTSVALWLLASLPYITACPSPKPAPPVDPTPRATVTDAGTIDGSVANAPLPRRLLLRESYRGVRAAMDNRDFTNAASLLGSMKVPDGTRDACAHRYLAARAQQLAGNGKAAADQWEALAKDSALSTCELVGYASLRAASARLLLHDAPGAEADANACPKDLAVNGEVKLALADALALANKKVEAAAAYREWYKEHKNAARFPQVALWLAKEVRDTSDPASRVEAYAMLTRIVVEAPLSTEAEEAERLRRTLGRTLTPRPQLELTALERAKRAQVLASGDRRSQAQSEVEAILHERNAPAEARCQAALLRPTFVPRAEKTRVAEAYAEAIATCTNDDDLATALYSGAKASYSAGRYDEALQRFSDVERRTPKHRFADDARFRAAFVYKDKGDDAKFVESLTSLPDAYPDGDMKTEALFRLALRSMAAGDDAAALPLLDRTVSLYRAAPLSAQHQWATAGRADYFRARLAEKTDRADAIKRYTEIIERYPLAYYMLQAHAQLALLEPKEALAARARAEARDDNDARALQGDRFLSSAAYQRAVALLSVDEFDAAKREFVSAGALGESAEASAVWLAASEYDAAELWETSHSYTRGKLVDYLEHYPRGPWRSAWEIAYPAAFAPIVKEAAVAYRVPASLVWGIMREESSFIAPVKSHAGAIGLMQLMPETAKLTARGTPFAWDEKSLKQPATSIPIGTKLLAQLRSSISHPAFAIAAYNAGPGALRKWGASVTSAPFDLAVELIPYEETRGYVKRVLSSTAAYAYLYDPASLPDLLSLPRKVDSAAGP